jgi:DNA-binding IclR family transcriptional regulator
MATAAGIEEQGWQSIGRALSLLEAIGNHLGTGSVVELASETGLKVPTAHRILKGLESRGFVVREPSSGEYSLGPTVLRLARSQLRNSSDGDLLLIAGPCMNQLREATGETVGFHVARNEHSLCVAELASHEPNRIAGGIGSSYILGMGAVGKVLLAYASPETIERTIGLPEFEKNSRIGSTLKDVNRSLAKIRKARYATSDGEWIGGTSAIAVPVLDGTESIRGAINVVGPGWRWTNDRRKAQLNEIYKCSHYIEWKLGRHAASGTAIDSTES